MFSRLRFFCICHVSGSATAQCHALALPPIYIVSLPGGFATRSSALRQRGHGAHLIGYNQIRVIDQSAGAAAAKLYSDCTTTLALALT